MNTRTFAASSLLTLLLALGGTDLNACGDKSLSAGGIRMQRALASLANALGRVSLQEPRR